MNFQNQKKNKLVILFLSLVMFTLFALPYTLAEDDFISESDSFMSESDSFISESDDLINEPPNYLNDHKQTLGVCIHAFLSFECPHCERIIPFLEKVADKYNIGLEIYDVSIDTDQEIYNEFKKVYSLEYGGYPIVFIGNKFFLGESDICDYLESEIQYCMENECLCPVDKIRATTYTVPKSGDYIPEEQQIITLPIINKEIDLSSMSLGVLTIAISFIDGFNPCSLWLLFFLLGILIIARSRIKMIIVGLTFLIVTALAYGLFISGIFSVFSYIQYIKQITYIVAGIALLFGLLNLKDYFWYKKGVSLTISDKYKPTIFKKIRNIMRPDSSIPQMVISTAIFALGITLVELPCTAGLPMVWSNILASRNIAFMNFLMLLALYLFVYLLIEIVILVIAIVTMHKFNFEEKHGRVLKLISGVIMLYFAYNFAFNYNFVNSVAGLFYIILFSIITVVTILVLHRIVLPKFNIAIGTEFTKENKDVKNKKNKDIENKKTKKNEEDEIKDDEEDEESKDIETKKNEEDEIKDNEHKENKVVKKKSNSTKGDIK